jgi:hypothetical protein
VSIPQVGWCCALWTLILVVAQPIRIILLALVLRSCGVPKVRIARWAVQQANDRWFVQLLALPLLAGLHRLPFSPPGVRDTRQTVADPGS